MNASLLLAVLAWVNVFALSWAMLLGFVDRGWSAGGAMVFFLAVAIMAMAAASVSNSVTRKGVM